MLIKGLYTALITPFDRNGKIDEEGFRKNIRFQIEHGCDGIVPLGTTGETPTLSHHEKERIIQISAEEAKNKTKLMVGTGGYSTQQTIENTLQAQQLGAEIALIVSPYYNKPTQEGIFLHYKAIAEAVDIPIIAYNVQGRTGTNIQLDTLKRLADIPAIIGVKEASGSIIQIGEVIENIARHRPDFSVMSGDDNMTFPLMALGGHGIISVASNLIPGLVKKMVSLLQQGKYGEAREMHYKMMPLFRGIFIETNPIPIKAAMNFCSMAAGGCRLPLCSMNPHNENNLKQIVKAVVNG